MRSLQNVCTGNETRRLDLDEQRERKRCAAILSASLAGVTFRLAGVPVGVAGYQE